MEKNNKKTIVDECACHMTLSIQALSLELSALAIMDCRIGHIVYVLKEF